jgi:hypothetical protein
MEGVYFSYSKSLNLESYIRIKYLITCKLISTIVSKCLKKVYGVYSKASTVLFKLCCLGVASANHLIMHPLIMIPGLSVSSLG